MAKRESGFTLIEAMIAIVILVFGLVAIAQLFVVASRSNVTARQATATADASSEVMDMLMARPYDDLSEGGGVADTDMTPGTAPTGYSQVKDVPGVGRVLTCWRITSPSTNVLAIHVRSQVVGLMSGLSRAEFVTVRTRTAPPAS